jgi:hypothetical protein
MAKRLVLKTQVCPDCAAVGSIRKILYGMPDPDNFDFEKFAVGGCCFNGDGTDPDFACRVCGWSGVRADLLLSVSESKLQP